MQLHKAYEQFTRRAMAACGLNEELVQVDITVITASDKDVNVNVYVNINMHVYVNININVNINFNVNVEVGCRDGQNDYCHYKENSDSYLFILAILSLFFHSLKIMNRSNQVKKN